MRVLFLILAVLLGVSLFSACGKLLPDEVLHEQYEAYPERAHLFKLAEHGNAEAEYRLGLSYCCGLGKGYNNEKAFNWFCQSAKRGHSQAMFEVGQMYAHDYQQRGWDWVTYRQLPAKGAYPKRDVLKAYVWYTLADKTAHGHSQALIQRGKLEKEMTMDLMDQAHQLIENWKEIPCGTGYMPWDDQMEYPADPTTIPEKNLNR
ncbi:MAG: sel1 repeat family protein [Proteobacteria bacterium]|nr:sel1 repeat family protein [Pseudomonadota bacterium]